jgi:hypothetical protein
MSVGHWNSLTEAEKLTQSQLIPGVIEEDIKRNNLLDVIPVAQALGKTIKWNREVASLEGDVANVDVGAQLSWTSSITYSQQETALKRCYLQRVLDDFIDEVYGTINDYEAQMLWECKKGVVRKLGDKLIYDDITYGVSGAFDGIHALAALQTGTDLDIDNGEAGLSLHNLRKMVDAMKHGVDAIYMPFEIGRRFDELYQERGLSYAADYSGATTMYNLMGMISFGLNEVGARVMFWDGIPTRRTDFLVAENQNVGDGSNLRAKYTADDKQYSVFAIKFGDIFAGNPGLCLGFGNTKNVGDFYKLVRFDALEDYDASGIRLVNYSAPLLGSKLCLGRIFDIEDAAVTA